MNLKNTDAVILCGGLGKRLRSQVGETPKVMAPVHRRPFLDILLDHLAKQGLGRIILCTGYKAEIIEAYYQKNPSPLRMEYSREQEPLGTGGALKGARWLIKSDPFVVLNGDSFCTVDFAVFLKFHTSKKALASLVISQVRHRQDFGSVLLEKGSSRIQSFLEKAPQALLPLETKVYVNAGVYCFNQEIFVMMPSQKNFSLEYNFFPGLKGENVHGFVVKKKFWDIGTPERYREVQQKLA